MIEKINKNLIRKKRHDRIRHSVKGAIKGTAETPRMNVYKSLSHIYVQLIDDVAGVTLCSASTVEAALRSDVKGKTKKEAARIVGAAAGKKALEKGITAVVFDRGGYLYTGRIKELADGAREVGLKI